MLLLTPCDAPEANSFPKVWDWTQWGHDQTLRDRGQCDATQLPASESCVLLVPADKLSWHRVQLPKVNANRLRATLEGLIEEHVLDDPGQLHFALENTAKPARGPSTVWMAACHKGWLQAAVHALQAAGQNVVRIAPACHPQEQAMYRAHTVNGIPGITAVGPAGVVRINAPTTNPIETVATLPPALRTLLASVHPDTSMPLAETDPACAAWAEAACPELAWETTTATREAQKHIDSPWNLAQFDLSLAGQSRRSLAIRQGLRSLWLAPTWRPARWGVAGLLLLQVLGLNLLAWQNRQHQQQQATEIRNLLTQTFPEIKLVLDAPLQMQREVNRLRQTQGDARSAEFEYLLQTMANASPTTPLNLQKISFTGGQVIVTGWSMPDDQQDSVLNALHNAGWRAQRKGTDWQMTRQELAP